MESFFEAIVPIIIFAIIAIFKIAKFAQKDKSPWETASASPKPRPKPKPRTKTKPLKEIRESQNVVNKPKRQRQASQLAMQQELDEAVNQTYETMQQELKELEQQEESPIQKKAIKVVQPTPSLLSGISPKQMIIMHEILSKPKGLQ